MNNDKGYVHIYTGNGKGKTTSCVGLTLRALGASKKVYFGQFMKDGDYSEIKALRENFSNVVIEQYGIPEFVTNYAPSDTQINKAQEGFLKAKEAVLSDEYDMVVLDEICVASFMQLIDINDVLELVKNKPHRLELVLSGRYAHNDLIDAADLVSEIKEIKHYYTQGVQARTGIEM